MTTQNGNIAFLWDTTDLADATLTVDPSAAEDSGWPVENLADTFRSVAAKFTTGAKVKVDFGESVYVSAVSLVDLICDPETPVTVIAYSDAFTTPAETFEFLAGQPIMLWGEGVWGAGLWGGYSESDDPHYGNQPRVEFVDTGDYAYRYWSIELDTSDPWTLGRAIFSNYFQPTNNFKWEWSHTLEDRTTLDYSPGGTPLSDAQASAGMVDISFDRLTVGEAFGEFLKMALVVGKCRDMVIMMTPDNDDLRPFTTIYGRFIGGIEIKNTTVGIYKAGGLKFKESL